jgi:anthranilate synthase/aminodeoxychorismate synthase-like glutamine amidotransferase
VILIVDNFDSFTYNLVDYFKQLNIEVDIVRNDVSPSSINWKKYQGLVLSPGPETPEKANFLMQYIECCEGKLPILGICLGHQALNIYFKGSIHKGIKPMHGKVSRCAILKEDAIFKDIPSQYNVVRYHSLKIDSLGKEMQILAESEDECPMIISHKNKCIYGIQYHPESILTQFGLKILQNWTELAGISK